MQAPARATFGALPQERYYTGSCAIKPRDQRGAFI
jgi:hypothetical protein